MLEKEYDKVKEYDSKYKVDNTAQNNEFLVHGHIENQLFL